MNCSSSYYLEKTTIEVFLYFFLNKPPENKIYYYNYSYYCNKHNMNHHISIFIQKVPKGTSITQQYDGQKCRFIIENEEKYYNRIISYELYQHLNQNFQLLPDSPMFQYSHSFSQQ
jgi:hypothetical protein